MEVIASISSGDYIGVGFPSQAGIMANADTVLGMAGGVSAYRMSTDLTASAILNSPKASSYLIYSTYSYDASAGKVTMILGRPLDTGSK